MTLLGFAYIVGIDRYRAYDIDTPWFLSFSYNYCHSAVQTDEFMQLRYPKGMDGVHLFGKVAAECQCLVLNRLGWTQAGVAEMNLVFCLASLWFWWSFLEQLGYRERWIAGFILLLGILEPTVSMVQKARYEFFAFFLLSAALWLASMGLEFAALLVALLALETQPAALLGVLMVFLFLALKTTSWQHFLLKAAVATAATAAIYVGLHPGAVSVIAASRAAAGALTPGGMISFYFVHRKRHLPELAFLIVGAWLYWIRRREITDRTAGWLGASAVVALLLATHVNAAYMVFGMPFMLWPAIEGYSRTKAVRWTPAILSLIVMAQYGYLYRANLHEGFDAHDLQQVQQTIDRVASEQAIAADQVQIAGDHSLWYGHPANYRAPLETDARLLPGANIFLCFDHPLMPGGLSAFDSMYCPEMKRDTPLREVSSLTLHGHLVHFLVRQ
jgi:hypothetical protein